MIKEKCNKCHNTVVGEFSPSATRKWLTTLAKKGGMKAVLTAAGSVIPGFGNVAGFIAGTTIDVIYGKDINKLIDKVADAFDDNKIYVFTCPNCGHTWSCKEEEEDINACDTEYCGESTDYYKSESSNSEVELEADFSEFLEKVDDAVHDLKLMYELYEDMGFKGNHYRNKNDIISSQYYFLGGLCALLYAKENYDIDHPHTVKEQLEQAWTFLKLANTLFPNKEYELMLASVDTLLADDPEECVNLGTIETEYYTFDNSTLFKKDYLIESYEECRFKSIVHADRIIDEAEDGEYDDSIRLKLWTSGICMQDKDYRMICYLNTSIYCTNRVDGEKVSLEEARALSTVVKTPGYSIENCDINNFYGRGWLEGCVYLAQSIIEDVNPYVDTDTKEQFNILEKISDLGECFPVYLAQESLGRYYENGIGVEKNVSKALYYYKKADCKKDIARLMTEPSSSGSSVSSCTSSSISSNETKYYEEVKSIFENGEISKGERRLLDKLRVKLGISESRATEIESSLLKPQLTEEEQEYLNEYNECRRESGVISSGERRLLNTLRITLQLSESRAAELEAMK